MLAYVRALQKRWIRVLAALTYCLPIATFNVSLCTCMCLSQPGSAALSTVVQTIDAAERWLRLAPLRNVLKLVRQRITVRVANAACMRKHEFDVLDDDDIVVEEA